MKRPNWHFALQNRVEASKTKLTTGKADWFKLFGCRDWWRFEKGLSDIYRTPIKRTIGGCFK